MKYSTFFLPHVRKFGAVSLIIKIIKKYISLLFKATMLEALPFIQDVDTIIVQCSSKREMEMC